MYNEDHNGNQNPYENQEGGSNSNPYGSQPGHNYYDERYRGGSGSKGGAGGYGNGSGGYYGGSGGPGGRKPKKKNSPGKILAAVALIVVFAGFCAGISWMAVNSIEEQVASAEVSGVPEESIPAAGEENPEEAVPSGDQADTDALAEQEQAPAGGGSDIASAEKISESGNVTTVVTDVTEVVEQVMPACVSITNNYTEQVQDFWGQVYSQEQTASGSGIIIGQNDEELLIVSNNHVVDDAEGLYVQFIDGEVVEAQTKGMDSSVDLAVVAVKLEDISEETRAEIRIAQMGDSDALKIGEPAIAIGNALGYGQSVTTGVISALNRSLEVSETGTSTALIQTDAAINPGNSGGALLNIKGEVVGINSNKIGSTVVEGMGYAIPISTAKPIIEELMTHETRSRVLEDERGYLGISCINVTSDLSENFGMPEGIFVAQVYEGTGADKAGIVRGNIVTKFQGTTVRTQDELNKQMAFYQAGETVEVTLMEGSAAGYEEKTVQVTLSSREELDAASEKAQQEQDSSGSNRLRP